MIIIRNANRDDISTIVKFNSAIAMETEKKSLDAVTVQKGIAEAKSAARSGLWF